MPKRPDRHTHPDHVLAEDFVKGFVARVRERIEMLSGLEDNVRVRRLDVLAPAMTVLTADGRQRIRAIAAPLLRLPPHAATWAAVAAASWAGFDDDDNDEQQRDSDVDDARIEQVLAAAKRLPAIGDRLGDLAWALFNARAYRVAVGISRRVVALPGLSRPTYANALYFVQHDNNHLGVDVEQHRFFLDNALAYADADPTIWFNAACLYAELGDVDAMIAMATSAVRAGYEGWKRMRDEPMLRAAVGDDPRWAAAFAPAEAEANDAEAVDDHADDEDDNADDEEEDEDDERDF